MAGRGDGRRVHRRSAFENFDEGRWITDVRERLRTALSAQPDPVETPQPAPEGDGIPEDGQAKAHMQRTSEAMQELLALGGIIDEEKNTPVKVGNFADRVWRVDKPPEEATPSSLFSAFDRGEGVDIDALLRFRMQETEKEQSTNAPKPKRPLIEEIDAPKTAPSDDDDQEASDSERDSSEEDDDDRDEESSDEESDEQESEEDESSEDEEVISDEESDDEVEGEGKADADEPEDSEDSESANELVNKDENKYGEENINEAESSDWMHDRPGPASVSGQELSKPPVRLSTHGHEGSPIVVLSESEEDEPQSHLSSSQGIPADREREDQEHLDEDEDENDEKVFEDNEDNRSSSSQDAAADCFVSADQIEMDYDDLDEDEAEEMEDELDDEAEDELDKDFKQKLHDQIDQDCKEDVESVKQDLARQIEHESSSSESLPHRHVQEPHDEQPKPDMIEPTRTEAIPVENKHLDPEKKEERTEGHSEGQLDAERQHKDGSFESVASNVVEPQSQGHEATKVSFDPAEHSQTTEQTAVGHQEYPAVQNKDFPADFSLKTRDDEMRDGTDHSTESFARELADEMGFPMDQESKDVQGLIADDAWPSFPHSTGPSEIPSNAFLMEDVDQPRLNTTSMLHRPFDSIPSGDEEPFPPSHDRGFLDVSGPLENVTKEPLGLDPELHGDADSFQPENPGDGDGQASPQAFSSNVDSGNNGKDATDVPAEGKVTETASEEAFDRNGATEDTGINLAPAAHIDSVHTDADAPKESSANGFSVQDESPNLHKGEECHIPDQEANLNQQESASADDSGENGEEKSHPRDTSSSRPHGTHADRHPDSRPITRSHCSLQFLTLHNEAGHPVFIVPSCATDAEVLAQEGAEKQDVDTDDLEMLPLDPGALPESVYHSLCRIVTPGLLDEVHVTPSSLGAQWMAQDENENDESDEKEKEGSVSPRKRGNKASEADQEATDLRAPPAVRQTYGRRQRRPRKSDPSSDVADYLPPDAAPHRPASPADVSIEELEELEAPRAKRARSSPAPRMQLRSASERRRTRRFSPAS